MSSRRVPFGALAVLAAALVMACVGKPLEPAVSDMGSGEDGIVGAGKPATKPKGTAGTGGAGGNPAIPTPTPKPLTMAEDNWEKQEAGTGEDLHSIAVKSVSSASGSAWLWAVGNKGTILNSTNRGATWTKVDSKTRADLYTISYVSYSLGGVESTTMAAAGANGAFVIPSDAGKTWMPAGAPIPSGATAGSGITRYLSVETIYSNGLPKSMFATSERYPMMMTRDGGLNWDDTTVRLPSIKRPWDNSVSEQDAKVRFGYYQISSTGSAFGLMLLRDMGTSNVAGAGCSTSTCIGYLSPGTVPSFD